MGLALLSAAPPLSTDMYLPALPAIAGELDTTQSMVQLTLSAFMVGMAVGQLLIGPLSDSMGRKRLLVGGVIASLLASVMCALAPSIGILILARLIQGLGGGACVVLARSIVPDLARGRAAAQAFTLLMLIQGIAPVIAPIVGGFLTEPFGWRSVFWVLSGINVAQLLVAGLVVRESLPVENRTPIGLRGMRDNFAYVLSNPRFLAYVGAFAFGFGTMFSYISASSFVLQEQFGVPALMYSLVFAGNALGMTLAGLVNKRLLQSFHPHHIMQVAAFDIFVLSVLILITGLVYPHLWLVLILLFLAISHVPVILSNATALGTAAVRKRAGSGSAVMGFVQFSFAGVISPLVGLGSNALLAMGTGMVVCGFCAAASCYVAGRGGVASLD